MLLLNLCNINICVAQWIPLKKYQSMMTHINRVGSEAETIAQLIACLSKIQEVLGCAWL